MRPSPRRKTVGIVGVPFRDTYQRLFEALEGFCPVEFRWLAAFAPAGLDGLIVLDGAIELGIAAAQAGVASLVLVAEDNRPPLAAAPIGFIADSPLIDVHLRGASMTEARPPAFASLAIGAGDRVLASAQDHPIWLAKSVGPASCQVVACLPPALRADQFLFEYLNARSFIRLLPLLNFLRTTTREVDWEAAPLRACFIFDDPSLYWPSYGFISYRQLAEHAEQHDYCVSVATIPLDTWWVNSGVAAILRTHRPRVSVLIHGNNHTSREMLSSDGGDGHLVVAAQALRRMVRLEHKYGVSFAKVMEAPHGALAHSVLRHLLTLGYDGALCTPELLVRHNPGVDWPATVGMTRSEILGGGLPVVPRIIMSPDWQNDVRLAGFLRQPIVVAGHHQDAAGDLQMLAELATLIRGMPGVAWSDLDGILRSNYVWKIEGDVLCVRLFARKVNVAIPPGVRRLQVERPWLGENQAERLEVRSGDSSATAAAGAISEPVPLSGASTVEIITHVENPVHFSRVSNPSLSATPWPIARKIIMEARDRLTPVLPFMDRMRRRNGRPPS